MRAATGQGTIRVTQRRVFVSEWTKLRSVRSTRWALLAAVVLTIGLAAIASAVIASTWAGMPAASVRGGTCIPALTKANAATKADSPTTALSLTTAFIPTRALRQTRAP